MYFSVTYWTIVDSCRHNVFFSIFVVYMQACHFDPVAVKYATFVSLSPSYIVLTGWEREKITSPFISVPRRRRISNVLPSLQVDCSTLLSEFSTYTCADKPEVTLLYCPNVHFFSPEKTHNVGEHLYYRYVSFCRYKSY